MVIVNLTFITFLTLLHMSLFTYCIRVWGVAACTKYLSQIDRLQQRAFRFGYTVQHVTSIQQVFYPKKGIQGCGVVLWTIPRTPCRIFSPHVEAELCAVGRILNTSQVLKRKGLRNALLIDASNIALTSFYNML